MQFLQPGRRKLAGWASFFLSKYAKELKTWITFQKLFFIQVFLRERRIHYWQPHWKKLTKSQNIFAKCPKKKKKFKTFFRKTNLSNCTSCKHVKSSSGSPASVFLTKGRKCFAQCQEKVKKLDRVSDIPNGKSSTECRKGLAQCANKTTQNHPMPTSKAVFTALPQSFCQKFEKFLLISGKDKNTYSFFKKLNFLQMFPVDT